MISVEGEDLRGRSALPLLASTQTNARVLFLGAPGEAVINTVPFTTPFQRVVVADALPFPTAAFGCVVIEAGGIASGRALRHMAAEVARVLQPDGDLLVLGRSSRIRRDLRSLRAYGLRSPAGAWTAALASHGFRRTATATSRCDRDRLVEIAWPENGAPSRPGSAATAGFEVGAFRREAAGAMPAMCAVLDEVAARLGSPRAARLERVLVRKIGKSALIASVGERRVIVRIPRSAMAEQRAERNFSALQQLHEASALPDSLRRLIPRALTRGVCRDYVYYVEECAHGRPLEDQSTRDSWEPDALAFLSDLHLRTRRAVIVDDGFFQQRFVEPVRVIQRALVPDHGSALNQLIHAMATIKGRELPLVWSHGDFALGNCLYDASGCLAAVVDWELFSTESLPLLDVLHSMPVPGETNSHPRWQRFDAVIKLLQTGTGRGTKLGHYVEAIGLSPSTVPALLVMYWVDHISSRIEGRCDDAAWMRKRVLQPLGDLRQLLD